MEEESESSLLTALTEILDSVEDDGGTLSPFDTLPASEYLNEQRARNPSSVGGHVSAHPPLHTTHSRLTCTRPLTPYPSYTLTVCSTSWSLGTVLSVV